ncbi:hypothetical protein E4A41_00235 [Micrococcus endophyticus]|nr:hypothetical protein E4A41_00235 [Micrococcus endophyticus]
MAPKLPGRTAGRQTGRQAGRQAGRTLSDARTIVDAIIYRYRRGIPSRELPKVYRLERAR